MNKIKGIKKSFYKNKNKNNCFNKSRKSSNNLMNYVKK